MGSSAPATSANVVFGVSLVISLALDLPKFITREPPPCIWFRMNRKNRMISTQGRKPPISDSSVVPLGFCTL